MTMPRLVLIGLLSFLITCPVLAQDKPPADTSTVFRIDSLPPQGVLLDKGWKWQAGDNPDWARPEFDDSKWATIDPTTDIFALPQIPKTGQIGWLRIKLAIANPNRSALSIGLQQVVASQIYLNGRLIHRIGYLSPERQRIKALNPNRFAYSLPRFRQQGPEAYICTRRIRPVPVVGVFMLPPR